MVLRLIYFSCKFSTHYTGIQVYLCIFVQFHHSLHSTDKWMRFRVRGGRRVDSGYIRAPVVYCRSWLRELSEFKTTMFLERRDAVQTFMTNTNRLVLLHIEIALAITRLCSRYWCFFSLMPRLRARPSSANLYS